jgi:hypothetical protein
MSDVDIDHLKTVARIIEFRSANILRVRKLLEQDIREMWTIKNRRYRERMCSNIYDKLDYIETLLSKNVDDIMSIEIMELDNQAYKLNEPVTALKQLQKDSHVHYIQ